MKTANKKLKMQMAKVYNPFTKMPIKMKEVDVYTLVIRENICRHLHEPLEQRLIVTLSKSKFPVKGCFYSNEYIGNSVLTQQYNKLKML